MTDTLFDHYERELRAAVAREARPLAHVRRNSGALVTLSVIAIAVVLAVSFVRTAASERDVPADLNRLETAVGVLRDDARPAASPERLHHLARRFGLRPDEAFTVSAPVPAHVGDPDAGAQLKLDLTRPWVVLPGAHPCIQFSAGAGAGAGAGACMQAPDRFARHPVSIVSGGDPSGERVDSAGQLPSDSVAVVQGVTADAIVAVRVLRPDGALLGAARIKGNRFALVVHGAGIGDFAVQYVTEGGDLIKG